MTIPGVGAVVALGYVASVDVAARFARSKAVGAAFGLAPRSISRARRSIRDVCRNAATP